MVHNKLATAISLGSLKGLGNKSIISDLDGLSNTDLVKLRKAVIQAVKARDEQTYRESLQKKASAITIKEAIKLFEQALETGSSRAEKILCDDEAFEVAFNGWFKDGEFENLYEALRGSVFSDSDTYRKCSTKEANQLYEECEAVVRLYLKQLKEIGSQTTLLVL